jgi:hypothetical protein
MAQLGEAVAADLAGSDSTRCPFDCDSSCDATNVFERVDKMGGSMTGGEPTIRYRQQDWDYKNDTSPIEAKYPPADKSLKNDWGWAAHHLIPVGSLKEHKLRKYLAKSYGGAKVSCDAGYNVNGVTNGKWLIGSAKLQATLKDEWIIAAVRAECRRAGIKIGKSIYSSMSADAKANEADELGFREWLYATMLHYNLQFHDSHSATDGYNDFVEQILNKVNANLKRLDRECPGGSKCKAAGRKPRAPHRIPRRLDFISSRLDAHLHGSPRTWKNPIFASEFSRMLAEEVQLNS